MSLRFQGHYFAKSLCNNFNDAATLERFVLMYKKLLHKLYYTMRAFLWNLKFWFSRQTGSQAHSVYFTCAACRRQRTRRCMVREYYICSYVGLYSFLSQPLEAINTNVKCIYFIWVYRKRGRRLTGPTKKNILLLWHIHANISNTFTNDWPNP